jgi:hypothetical protein
MTLPTVHTFYKSNIDPELVSWQARVFETLGIPLKQWLDDSASHHEWLNRIFRDDSLGEQVIVADIDAFPLSRAGFDRFLDLCAQHDVVGLAQVANHKDPSKIYAAPMFLGTTRAHYKALGSPSMRRTDDGDVAQILTDQTLAAGKSVEMIYPRFSIDPKWPLWDRGVYGIGTFYGEMEFFHLFQARKKQAFDLFCAVAEGVVNGRHDFARYLEIMEKAPAPKKKFLGLF